MIAEVNYDTELVAFEPKMRSMIRNFRRIGYRFHGYDNDDLTQELFVKALQKKPYYNCSKSAIRTWWYQCFRNRLIDIDNESSTVLRWLTGIHGDNFDLELAEPYFVKKDDEWRSEAVLAVHQMIDNIKKFDKKTAEFCQMAVQYNSEKVAIMSAMGITRYETDKLLTKLRSYAEYDTALDAIPF